MSEWNDFTAKLRALGIVLEIEQLIITYFSYFIFFKSLNTYRNNSTETLFPK
jgi:hypothetical protein